MGKKHKKINSLRFFYVVLFFFSSILGYSQTSITGKVSNNKASIQGVRVSLQKAGSSSFLAYTFTDETGSYTFSNVEKGDVTIHANALSYQAYDGEIKVGDTPIVHNIELQEGVVREIKEVIINKNPKFRFKKDTIELDAKAFARGDERTVEDLLKKIPGLNVEKDGTIKIGNKEVEKVMIENDDLFEKGYKLLTQSMSVKPIEKIQVLQHYSNNKHLKGIENSDKVALNLTLKEDAKRQFFGNTTLEGSFYPESVYNVSTNVMNFGKKNKYFFLGKANNNGVDAVSSINSLVYSSQENEAGTVGENIQTPTVLDNTPNLSNFDYTRTNFNNDKLLSLNTIFNPSPKLKIKLLGFTNFTGKKYFRNAISSFTTPSESFTNTEEYKYKKSIDTYFGKWEIIYDPKKNQTISYVGNLGKWLQNDRGNLIFNEDPSNEITDKEQLLTNHKLTYTNRFSENKVWVSSIRYISQKSPANYSINKYYYEDIFQQSGNAFSENLKNDVTYFGAKSELVTKIKNGNVFQAALYFVQQRNIFESTMFLEKPTGDLSSPDGFINDLRLTSKNLGATSKYTFKFSRIEFVPELDMRWTNTSLDRLGEIDENDFVLLNPKFYTKWNIHKKGELVATVSYRSSLTNILDVLPTYYNDGLRSFSKGIDDMQSLQALSSTLAYTLGRWTDRLYVNFVLGMNKDYDYLSPNVLVQPNFSLSQNQIVKNRNTTFAKTQINYYLKFLSSNLKINLSTSISDFQNSVNDEVRDVTMKNNEYGFELRSVWKFWLNMNVGTSFNAVNYQSISTNKVLNNTSFIHFYFKFSKNLTGYYKNEMYYFGNHQISGKKSYFFGDFGLNWKVEKYKCDLSLTGKNLYNTNVYRTVNVTDYYSSTVEYKLLPRYVMMGIDFNF